MKFVCKNEYFDITDPILLSARTIIHIKEDCLNINIIEIPDSFYDVINYVSCKIPHDFDKELKLLKFYDFLNVDEIYILNICANIGEYVEKTQPSLETVIQNILLEYYLI